MKIISKPQFVVFVNFNNAMFFVYCGLCCVFLLHKIKPHTINGGRSAKN